MAAEQHGYRTRDPRPLPADTGPIGAPPRTLPRRLRLALLLDEGLWHAALFTMPCAAILAAMHSAAAAVVGLLLLLTSVLTASTMGWMFYRRARLVRLLETGVVAPIQLVARRESRLGSIDQTRMRVLSGWRREIESYQGPILHTTLRIGLEHGPSCQIVRRDAEWGGDLCLFDAADPTRHVLIEDLPPFVGVRAEGGWAFVATERPPRGTLFALASGAVAVVYATLLCGFAMILAAVFFAQ